MPKSNTELKVGAFVLAGLLVFLYMIFSISDFNLLKDGYFIYARFEDIAGLEAGAPVDFIGVKVGEVRSIDIVYDEAAQRQMVELRLWIKKGINVKEDSVARLRRLGLMGEQYVHLSLGGDESPVVPEGGVVYSEKTPSIDDVTRELFMVTREFRKTLDSVNSVVDDVGFQSHLKETAHKARNATENLEDLTADLKANPWKLFMLPKTRSENRPSGGSGGGYRYQEGK